MNSMGQSSNRDESSAASSYPEDDPLTMALLEAHALLSGINRDRGIDATPGPRNKAVAKIEAALRMRKAELSLV